MNIDDFLQNKRYTVYIDGCMRFINEFCCIIFNQRARDTI